MPHFIYHEPLQSASQRYLLPIWLSRSSQKAQVQQKINKILPRPVWEKEKASNQSKKKN
jgi:hypothetical protein